jgi:hypothetical protein
MLKDVDAMPMLEVMEIARKAEEHRIRACITASKYYLKKKARERGISVEEYVQQRVETRGRKRIYYPDGVVPGKN